MSSPPRPKPKLDSVNRAFWTGGAEGKLMIVKCGDCGEFTHPPQILCRHCQSENVAPTAVAGSSRKSCSSALISGTAMPT